MPTTEQTTTEIGVTPTPVEPTEVNTPSKSKAPKEKLPDNVCYYFELNGLKSEVYGTADGFLFEGKGDAIKQAETLENKDVTTYKKPSDGSTKN